MKIETIENGYILLLVFTWIETEVLCHTRRPSPCNSGEIKNIRRDTVRGAIEEALREFKVEVLREKARLEKMKRKCSACHNTKSVQSFYKMGSGYYMCYCKLCCRAIGVKDRQHNKRPRRVTRFCDSRYRARARGIIWDLTEAQFYEITENPCYYCGGVLPKTGGLDRLDNQRGYEPLNIVPCCTICNRVRGDHYSPEETKIAVQAVMAFRQSRGNASNRVSIYPTAV